MNARLLNLTRPRTAAAWRMIVLLAILLLAFGLRMARAGELRMWGDEAFSVFSAHRTLAAITFEGAENDPHPPLYYYLLHFYIPLAGASELALRFFSVFPGVLTVALLYVTGKRLFNRRAGLLASGFGAIAPFDVYYSQEIRMYALAIFLTTLAFYFFVLLLQQASILPAKDDVGPGWAHPNRIWPAYALPMLLALYSLYHTAFVFLAEGLFLLAFWKTRRTLVVRWLIVSSGIVVLFLPWLWFRFSSTLGHLEDRAGRNVLPLPVFVARGLAALTAGPTLPPAEAVGAAVLFFVLIAVAAVMAFRARRAGPGDVLVWALAIVPILVVYPLYFLLPIFVARLFALAFAPLALLVGRSLAILNRRLAAPLALGIVLISAFSLRDYYFRFDRYNAAAEDYVPLIRAVEEQAQAGDVVLFHAYWQMGYFLSHYAGPPLKYLFLDNESNLEEAVAQPRNVFAVIQDLALHGSEVWLVQHAFPTGESKFGQMRLSAYRAGLPESGSRFEPPLFFDNGIALLGYHLNREPLESGRGLLTVELDWQAGSKTLDDYTVSVRLTGTQGKTTWLQDDAPPASGTRPTSSWLANEIVADRHTLVVPAGTPPGDYDVQVVLYQSASGGAASVIAPENWRGQSVSLGTVQVSRPLHSVPIASIPHPLFARWNEITLAGFESGAAELRPGDVLPLTFYWQADQKPSLDYAAAIRVVDAAGAVRAAATYHPANDTFRTSAWNAGEIWIDKMALDVDAGAASGEAEVWIDVQGAGSGEPAGVRSSAPILLTRVSINAREHRFNLPVPAYPLQADLGDNVRLLGYDLDRTDFSAGAKVELQLYWQARTPVKDRYTVFVHLVDASGDLVAQKDGEPENGNAPTTSWLPGEVIADRYRIDLPEHLPPGEYRLELGMYQAANGRRLAVDGSGSDHILLKTIHIGAP